jgi:hypothetical protein
LAVAAGFAGNRRRSGPAFAGSLVSIISIDLSAREERACRLYGRSLFRQASIDAWSAEMEYLPLQRVMTVAWPPPIDRDKVCITGRRIEHDCATGVGTGVGQNLGGHRMASNLSFHAAP